jgi:hypothetical protein
LGERWQRWRWVVRGAGFGVLGGLAIPCVQFAYEQLTHPNPYSVLTFIGAPVYAALGGMLGLLVAAWYRSD